MSEKQGSGEEARAFQVNPDREPTFDIYGEVLRPETSLFEGEEAKSYGDLHTPKRNEAGVLFYGIYADAAGDGDITEDDRIESKLTQNPVVPAEESGEKTALASDIFGDF